MCASTSGFKSVAVPFRPSNHSSFMSQLCIDDALVLEVIYTLWKRLYIGPPDKTLIKLIETFLSGKNESMSLGSRALVSTVYKRIFMNRRWWHDLNIKNTTFYRSEDIFRDANITMIIENQMSVVETIRDRPVFISHIMRDDTSDAHSGKLVASSAN